MKDLISGRRKRIMGKDVRHVTIPQYDNLTIQEIAKFVAPYGEVGNFLPSEKEIAKLPK